MHVMVFFCLIGGVKKLKVYVRLEGERLLKVYEGGGGKNCHFRAYIITPPGMNRDIFR